MSKAYTLVVLTYLRFCSLLLCNLACYDECTSIRFQSLQVEHFRMSVGTDSEQLRRFTPPSLLSRPSLQSGSWPVRHPHENYEKACRLGCSAW